MPFQVFNKQKDTYTVHTIRTENGMNQELICSCFPRLKNRQQLHQSNDSKQYYGLLEILEKC